MTDEDKWIADRIKLVQEKANIYSATEKKPQEYTSRVVAFFDILGWRSKVISAGSDPAKIAKLHNILLLFSLLRSNEESNAIPAQLATSFSDNVVISTTLKQEFVHFALIQAAAAQLFAAAEGFFVRGGITVGQIFHDRNVVFGPALNRAYELESRHSKYPRLTVDPDTLQQFGDYSPLVVDTSGDIPFIDTFHPRSTIAITETLKRLPGPDQEVPSALKLVARACKSLQSEMTQPLSGEDYEKLAWLYDRVRKLSGGFIQLQRDIPHTPIR